MFRVYHTAAALTVCVILSRYLQISGLLWRKFSTVPSNFRRIRGSPDSFRSVRLSLRIADSASESGTRRAFAVAHEAPFMEAKTPSTNAKKARTYALLFLLTMFMVKTLTRFNSIILKGGKQLPHIIDLSFHSLAYFRTT